MASDALLQDATIVVEIPAVQLFCVRNEHRQLVSTSTLTMIVSTCDSREFYLLILDQFQAAAALSTIVIQARLWQTRPQS